MWRLLGTSRGPLVPTAWPKTTTAGVRWNAVCQLGHVSRLESAGSGRGGGGSPCSKKVLGWAASSASAVTSLPQSDLRLVSSRRTKPRLEGKMDQMLSML